MLRSASDGESRAALSAGERPAIAPTAAAAPTTAVSAGKGTAACQCRVGIAGRLTWPYRGSVGGCGRSREPVEHEPDLTASFSALPRPPHECQGPSWDLRPTSHAAVYAGQLPSVASLSPSCG
jgi:hypothetical protein